jgi:predicted dehydrogenase
MKLKLGMVGGGEGAFIGGVHRIAARLDDRYQLVAGALSSDATRAKQSAEALGIAPDRTYTDFEEMARAEKAHPDGIDVVAIVTPNFMHFPVARAFLEAGIHVICDKPVTTSLEDALALKELVKSSGAYFALTHNYTGYPLVRQAREMVQQGKLGNIRVVQAEYVQDWMSEKAEDTDNKQAQWRSDPKRSGPAGCLGDIGTHAFNLAQFIAGNRATEVAADLATFVPGRRLDDNVHVMLRFNDGAKGMLWASQVAPGNENALCVRIYGDKGGLEWHQETPNELWFTPLGEPTRKLTRGGPGSTDSANRGTRIPPGHPEGYLEGFATLYSNIADVIQKAGTAEAALVPGIDAGIEGMRWVEAVIRSSENNSAWESLAE